MSKDPVADALAVAIRLFHSLHVGDWSDAAMLVTAEDQAKFRDAKLSSLISWAQYRDLMRDMRKRGTGVVGWSSSGVVSSESLDDVRDVRLRGLPNIATVGELADLSPETFLAVYLDVTNARVGAVEGGPMERPRRRAIGGIADGTEVVHVLYRAEGPGIEYDDPHHVIIARFRQRNDAWFFDVNVFGQDIADESRFMMLVDDEL